MFDSSKNNEELINSGSYPKSYDKIIREIKNLPTIPSIIFEVSKLLDDPMTNASELAELISKDQGMVAKVLAVANSPLYGLPKKISTIEFAIVILGFENIKNIILALSMLGAFKGKGKNWNRQKYWHHCLATASIAKKLAEDLGYHKSGEAFTSGLLHDLGISVIQLYFNNEFNEILKLVNIDQFSYLEAENEILNLTHQEIGNFLAEKWNLPKPLSDSILFHHNPGQSSENKFLVSIIHLADYLTQELCPENFGFEWDKDIKFDYSIIEVLRFGSELYMNDFIESYREIFQNHLEPLI
jgi:putative nucleotidyltransferase with HDIG domain